MGARTYGTLTYVPDGPGGRAQWHLDCEPHVTIRIKRLFPRISQTRRGTLTVTASDEVARDLEWVLERWPLELDEPSAAALATSADQHRRTEEQVTAILAGHRPAGTWRTPARAARWPHQDTNADLITAQKRLLITDSLGAGKTHSGAMALRNPDSLPALVVVQAHLPQQWKDQLELTWPDLRAHIVAKSSVYDIAATRDCGGVDPDVLIISYSKLAGWAEHLAGKVRTVIFDEVQELRNGVGTAKGRAAAQISDAASYVIGLSGTPVVNYGDDIHSIYSIVRPDVLGSRDEFLREWCNVSNNGKAIVADPRALGAFLRDQGVMVGVQLKSPDPVRIAHTVDSDHRVFDQMTGDAVDMAKRILSRSSTRSERFTTAGQFDMVMRQATGIAKAPYVAQFANMLLESVDKIVLFGWHRSCWDVWLDKLAVHNPVLYTGSETAVGKLRAKDAFVNGNSRILMMSLRSGAGLDGLQEVCHTAVFGELDWSPSIHAQAIGRLDRPGQTESVLAYFLTSNEGTDPMMIDRLGVKTRQAEPIVDPAAARIKVAEDNSEQVRDLARALLKKRRIRVDEPDAPSGPSTGNADDAS